VFGWGNKSPLFNLLPNYWPVAELNRINPNHIIVDVGKLYGGQVDYGEAHSAQNGHLRFGATYPTDTAKHTRWSAVRQSCNYLSTHSRHVVMHLPLLSSPRCDTLEHPVHLLGHSYGATTAIELYQLLCADFFQVGFTHAWVKSIVCISGPLTG
ncbi:hypothetical protein AaE_009765, partial [Aphanomyces astaci]